MLAYYRLVINNKDEDSLQRTINTPARGIGKTTMEKITVAADENGVNMWEVLNDPGKYKLSLNTGLLTKINNFTTLIKSFAAEMRKKDAYESARHIAVSSGILKMYREDDAPEAISRVENIDELLNGIKEFVDRGAKESQGDLENQGTLEEFMQDVSLLTNQDNEDEEDKDKVTLMTIHSAKGLEFPYVYVVGLEENLFPSIQAINTRSDLEEERRLFYVAITRAETQVTLSFAESRYRWGQFTLTEPSRFLEEIDENLVDMPHRPSKNNMQSGDLFGDRTTALPKKNMKAVSSVATTNTSFEESDTTILQTGMKVEHPKFGKGKVTSVEGNGPNKKATVFFNGVGQKSLLLRFAKLKILS